jgi:hypothetical protein
MKPRSASSTRTLRCSSKPSAGNTALPWPPPLAQRSWLSTAGIACGAANMMVASTDLPDRYLDLAKVVRKVTAYMVQLRIAISAHCPLQHRYYTQEHCLPDLYLTAIATWDRLVWPHFAPALFQVPSPGHVGGNARRAFCRSRKHVTRSALRTGTRCCKASSIRLVGVSTPHVFANPCSGGPSDRDGRAPWPGGRGAGARRRPAGFRVAGGAACPPHAAGGAANYPELLLLIRHGRSRPSPHTCRRLTVPRPCSPPAPSFHRSLAKPQGPLHSR